MLPNIRGPDDADGVSPPRLRHHAHLAPPLLEPLQPGHQLVHAGLLVLGRGLKLEVVQSRVVTELSEERVLGVGRSCGHLGQPARHQLRHLGRFRLLEPLLLCPQLL